MLHGHQRRVRPRQQLGPKAGQLLRQREGDDDLPLQPPRFVGDPANASKGPLAGIFTGFTSGDGDLFECDAGAAEVTGAALEAEIDALPGGDHLIPTKRLEPDAIRVGLARRGTPDIAQSHLFGEFERDRPIVDRLIRDILDPHAAGETAAPVVERLGGEFLGTISLLTRSLIDHRRLGGR